MTTAMCSGTFDILHEGHLYYLREAKKFGDRLIVVVARDSTSGRIKEKKPINNENKRLESVKKIKIADRAILGNEGDIFDIIDEIKPDVICLGYDQKISEEQLKNELKKRGANAVIVRLNAYMPDVYKSSKMK